MRIVNKEFHDYYDKCMSYGVDMTVVYDRKYSELEHDNNLVKKSNRFLTNIPTTWYGVQQNRISEEVYGKNFRYVFESGVIGFCGIIYPFLRIDTIKDVGCTYESDIEYIYNFDEYSRFITKRKIGKNSILHNMKAMKDFFTQMENIDFFFDIKNPIFINIPFFYNRSYNKERKLLINPNLSDYAFYKVIDSMSAFQKISSFLSGVLGGVHPPTLEVSDEVKKHKAGFGHKYAFKKEPTKRKIKKESN